MNNITTTPAALAPAPAPAFNWSAFKTATLAKGKLPYAIWYAKDGLTYYECADENELNLVINDCRAGADIIEESYFECYVDGTGKFHSKKSKFLGRFSRY